MQRLEITHDGLHCMLRASTPHDIGPAGSSTDDRDFEMALAREIHDRIVAAL